MHAKTLPVIGARKAQLASSRPVIAKAARYPALPEPTLPKAGHAITILARAVAYLTEADARADASPSQPRGAETGCAMGARLPAAARPTAEQRILAGAGTAPALGLRIHIIVRSTAARRLPAGAGTARATALTKIPIPAPAIAAAAVFIPARLAATDSAAAARRKHPVRAIAAAAITTARLAAIISAGREKQQRPARATAVRLIILHQMAEATRRLRQRARAAMVCATPEKNMEDAQVIAGESIQIARINSMKARAYLLVACTAHQIQFHAIIPGMHAPACKAPRFSGICPPIKAESKKPLSLFSA